jgi:NTP pyrophosphatase (non-canonical NTP hydrolase)
MTDTKVTLQELKERVATFVAQRDWNQFHAPKNLSMTIAAEAAELLEKFLWVESKDSYAAVDNNRSEVEDELADVLFAVLCFANAAGIDLSSAFATKFAKIEKKYPIDKVRGKSNKYTDY